jgi:cyanophycin synthetase
MAESAGLTSGYTSSDGVVVGRTWTATGDWTGPGAARSLLRDPQVDFAVLETARGGLMRRGLALTGADAAAVTNISDDHLGEWGLDSLADLAWAKLTVAHAVKPQGVIVIRKADPSLAAALPALLAARPDLSVCTFADADPTADAWAQEGTLFLREADQITPILPETEIPLTMGGLVRPMVENALCASLLARALGLPIDAIRGGLRALTPDPERSKGRMNRLRLPNGARALLDFAHNPAGIRALHGLAHAPRAGRLLCLAGQAGDREDAQLETYAEALATLRPDLVLLKELPHYRRGRAEGEIRTILRRCLLAHGLRPDQLIDEPEELDAVRRAIDLSAPGDLLFLLVHEEPEATLDLLLSAGATLG